MAKNDQTAQNFFDQARDELFSHIVRCKVLEAAPEDQAEWLKETMEYMADRYPDLTPMHLAQLEVLGKRYISPAIPHGNESNALRNDVQEEDEGERDAA